MMNRHPCKKQVFRENLKYDLYMASYFRRLADTDGTDCGGVTDQI